MITKHLSNLLLIMLISFCSYYLFTKYDWGKDSQVQPSAEYPLFSSQKIETVSYDVQGVRNYSLSAEQLEYYEFTDETFFLQPLLHTFNNGENQEWRVSADKAILKDKNILVMLGNVRMHNLLPEVQIKTITTSQITINLTSRDFWTESEIRISGISFFTRGDRAKGNFDTQTMELTDKVEAIYETATN